MTTSLAAFLYGSFDPGLFVSVDKPAPGLWPQAVVARVFGFSSMALLLPQAISGIASVYVLGRIVAAAHGALAGVVAALALAVAPVAVAVDRNNTMDAELVLVLLLAAACALRATRQGARWLVLAGVLVGLGFAIKMSQAFVVLPALALAYLVASRASLPRRLAHLALFCTVTLAVSALWIAFVDLTPSSARPYVGSSTNNSALELAVGHNGLARLPQELLWWRRTAPAAQPPAARPAAPQPAPPGPGPTAEAGERGPLRLFNEQLAGQVSWYIPLALVGALAVILRERRGGRVGPGAASVALWLAWLVPTAVLFSWSGIFHRYYLVMLAPPCAALVGAGVAALVSSAQARSGRALVVAGAVATAITHLLIVQRAGDFSAWLAPVIAAGTVATLAALVATSPLARRALASIAVASAFAAPVVWASTTLVAADAGLPFAGPELLRRGPSPGPNAGPVGPAPRSRLYEFLVSEHRGERWIAATSSQSTASALMLRGDVAVMAMGGFSGSDPILTPRSLEEVVRRGDVRFILVEERMRPELGEWVRRRCAVVPTARYGAPALAPVRPGEPSAGLFDCGSVRM